MSCFFFCNIFHQASSCASRAERARDNRSPICTISGDKNPPAERKTQRRSIPSVSAATVRRFVRPREAARRDEVQTQLTSTPERHERVALVRGVDDCRFCLHCTDQGTLVFFSGPSPPIRLSFRLSLYCYRLKVPITWKRSLAKKKWFGWNNNDNQHSHAFFVVRRPKSFPVVATCFPNNIRKP